MLSTLFRTIIIYFSLIAVLRLTGKRQIGQMQPSELVVTLMLSELAVAPINNPSIPILHTLIPITLIVVTEIIIAYFVTKSPLMKRAFDGTPSFLIAGGKLIQHELARQRVSMEELLTQLRLCGYPNISDVCYAILEPNGQLSVIPKAAMQPIQRCDQQIHPDESGLPHPLIIDGAISEFNLSLIGKDKTWLRREISRHGATVDQVFYFSQDDSGQQILIRKELP